MMDTNKITKAHCFFEQSGTFKNEFIKIGIPAEDYDIQNNFGETDHVVDLFAEIERAYDNVPSLFDAITPDDLIVAFFPCIYFCDASTIMMRFSCIHYINMSFEEMIKKILERWDNRTLFMKRLIKLVSIVRKKRLRLIIENPYSGESFLKSNFVIPPTIIDHDRTIRGDYFKKPTAYWFVGCEPTYGISYARPDKIKKVNNCKKGKEAGVCSEERSMISKDYAINFICDFILGKKQPNSLPLLF